MAEEEREEQERVADVAARRAQAARRARYWGADNVGGEGNGEVERAPGSESPRPPWLGDTSLEKAKRDVRTAIASNRDVGQLTEALQHYYYAVDGKLSERGILPEKVDIVHSGCIAAQLMHHPTDLDRRAYQSVFASPSFRGNPRYSRVAVVAGDDDDDADEEWRAEVRLLFRAYRPDDPKALEDLALVKYFELNTGRGREPLPPCVLTHLFRRGGEDDAAAMGKGKEKEGGAGSGSRSGGQRTGIPTERKSSSTGRYTGAIRLRFAPETRRFGHRFAVMPISNFIRVEHVLQDFTQQGLDGSFETFYVNPYKWGLEDVGDDEARGEHLQMAPL